MFRLSTLTLVISLSFTAFAITPGPERPVSSIVYAPPAGEQRPGAVATDGSDFLALWTDVSLPRAGVYATRIPSAGTVGVNAERLVRAGSAREVALCYAGGGYLAAWSDAATNSVFSAKLSSDGSVIAGPRLIIAGETENDLVTNPASVYLRGLACSSSGALLVFKKGSPSITTLDANGLVNGTAKKLAIGDDDPVVAVSDGTKYFIGTRSIDTQTVSIMRVAANGDLTDATPQPIFTGFGATQIGLAFAGNRLGLGAVNASTLKRAFVDPASLTATKLPDVAQGGQEVNVVASGNALETYVGNYNLSKLDVLRVQMRDNESSAPTPSTALHSDFLGSSVGVASTGSTVLAVWKDFRRSTANSAVDGDVFAATLDTGNGAGTPFPVVVTARWQGPVAIASSGTESFVVWNERTGDAGKAALMGMRVDPKGVLLDAAPQQIAASVVAANAPSIVWDGSTYVVAWYESAQTNFGLMTTVVVQRFKRDGTTQDSAIRYDGPFTAALGSNGSGALLAFTYPDGRGMNVVLLGDPATIKPLNVYGYNISIASASSDYLVVYTEGAETCQIICFPDKRDISGIRVSGTGTILDTTPIAIANGPKDQTAGHVASNGTDYLIAYDFLTDQTWSVGAKRVTRSGQLVDSLPNQDGVVIADDVAVSNAIVRDDSSYVVAYDAGGGPDVTVLRLARVDDKGNVLERSGNLGAGTRSVPTSPALTKVSGGPVDIAYSRYATETVFGGTLRAFVRLAPDSTPQPGKIRAVRH